MWGQGFYDGFKGVYKEDTNQWIKEVGDRFMEICGNEYILVRSMLAGNTFDKTETFMMTGLYPVKV